MIEADFLDLVERHRQEQPMGLPPADLLARARLARTVRRRRRAVVPGALLLTAALVVGAVRTIGDLAATSPQVERPTVVPSTAAPTTRLVGINGWVVAVPASWGTDQVGCDGITAIRPSVLFDHHVQPPGPTRHCPRPRTTVPFVRVGGESFPGVPWRTVSGVEVDRRSSRGCESCATLRVPTANVSFEIRATRPGELRRIEDSLRPLSTRQITVPVWTDPGTGPHGLDQMTVVATGQGLRPQVFEVPSRRPPGTFLRSTPPLGTPVDLGRAIALYYSAGDLGRFATAGSLGRHGWRIYPVTSARPSYGRVEARQTAGVAGPSAGRHPAYLRSLTIIHEGPRLVVVRRRLTWLVVSTDGGPGGSVSITAVDADTDRVIESQSGFRGRHP